MKRFSPQIKFVFSSGIVQNDKNNNNKEVLDTNAILRRFRNQNNIDYIDNTNIKEDHLGIKNLRLNKRGNSVYVKPTQVFAIKTLRKCLTLTASQKVMMNINIRK